MRKRIRRLVFVTGMLLVLAVTGCALQPAESTSPAESTNAAETASTEAVVETAYSTEESTEAESTEAQTEGETLSPEEQILEDRRETVVEYMRSMLTVMWRAGVDIDYENHEGDSFSIKAGRIYRGMPYTNAAGTLTSFLEYAEKRDEKGVYLITGLNSEALDGGAAVVRVGSDCSSSVYTAWSQIGASVRCTATRYMCEDNGYIKVGEYQSHPSDLANPVINGPEVMSAAYAKLKKGDILVSNGHVMMVADVSITYDQNGKIDMWRSFVTVLEQTRSLVKSGKSYMDEALGETVYLIGGVDQKYLFDSLYAKNYLPYTCKELIDPSTVEAPYVVDSEKEHTADNLLSGTISSNWSIDAVTVTIMDETNNVVQQATGRVRRYKNHEYDLQQLVTDVPETILGRIDLSELDEGNYRCTVVCRLTTGQEFVVRDFGFNPHTEMELTREEGETKSLSSDRIWKTISGAACRQDMEHGELRYSIYLPEGYDSKTEYPLLLYLHGGDLGYHRSGGYTPWAKELNGFDEAYAEIIAEAIDNCIIFVPQAPGAPREVKDAVGAYWSGMPTGMVGSATEDKSESSSYLRAVEKTMAEFLEKGISHSGNVYSVDASRLYVTGHSMGAIGTYTIFRDCPDMFAAAIIGAGIGDPESVDFWKNTPVRIYHGTNDKVIPYESTRVMAAALENNKNAEIRTLEGVGHSIQSYMYLMMNEEGKSESFSWMAEQSRE